MSRLVAHASNAAARLGRASRLASGLHARVYRATRGRLLPRWFGAPVLVLETVGRRSGRPRATPVIYARDGNRYVLLAANAGSDRTPAWWLNLRESGRGHVVVGARRLAVDAREAVGEEREALWATLCEVYPSISAYTSFTSRRFPVVVLTPLA